MDVEAIAMMCHEANRAYCLSQGDSSQLSWEEAPDWQRKSAIAGVEFHLSRNVRPVPPSASHENWLKQKLAEGWCYGPVKDAEKLEHPCMVAFEDLPREQQAKDYLFGAVVATLEPFLDQTEDATTV